MAIATFKDLCIDATDPTVLGPFWAAALGLDVELLDDGDAHLSGPTSVHTVWVNRVPEAKTVKHRVHLDVHTGSIDQLIELGAGVVDADSFPWTVMTDPEGGEFCAFVRDEPPGYRLHEVVVDCADHESLSAWWAALIGGDQVIDERGFSTLVNAPGVPFDGISFVPVPEPKSVKNRLHIDLIGDEEPSVVIDAGARLLRARDDEIDWHVLADPGGNEFCYFTR